MKLIFKLSDEQRAYARAHIEVKNKRGKASEYLCVDCDKQARDWSHTHSTPYDDVRNYKPRCSHCHHIYDLSTPDDLPKSGAF